ncbi:fimbrillin family protein [Porphyromonas crevioricanis]|uniref:BACON domain-containing protein n=1 Tax=Porphyromonas crevioricanis TaxID=393921 RepID=A0AB34PFS3_9PORP|nr:fimbrillin family protein [Porphyromonas crevioricanis]KGN95095.1 hypothetical protein HQ38_04780 [Porphyromonas crevioricanis]
MKMKWISFTLLAALSLIGFTACNSTDEPDYKNGYGDQPVNFETNIRGLATRAHDTKWDNNDAIGIFMFNSGSNISNVSTLPAANKQYITPEADGKFVPANAENTIVFPGADQKVDIIAYYPYTQTLLSGNIYNVDIAKQAPLSNIDLLYSNDLKNVSASTPKDQIKLGFRHMLSKIIFEVSMSDGSAISDMSATLKGFETKAKFNLSDGTLTNVEGTKDFAAIVKDTKAEAIIIPKNAKIGNVDFVVGGKTYVWKPKDDLKKVEAGKKYTFKVKLMPDGTVETLNPGGTITDWDKIDGGEYEINAEGGDTPADITIEGETTLNFDKTASTKTLSLKTTGKFEISKPEAANWITITPASGSGDTNVEIKVTANETTSERTADLTIKSLATKSTTGKTITITIKQAGKEDGPQPASNLLFPGSDFENWDTFMDALAQYKTSPKIPDYASKAEGLGMDGKTALQIKGKIEKNPYLFTVKSTPEILASLKGKSRINFYVKGSISDGRSLSINIYQKSDKYKQFPVFNMGDIKDKDILVEASPTNENAYKGEVNTNGKWIKVSLDISKISNNEVTTANMFALKTGGTATYDLLIDNITVE